MKTNNVSLTIELIEEAKKVGVSINKILRAVKRKIEECEDQSVVMFYGKTRNIQVYYLYEINDKIKDFHCYIGLQN